ncbi:DUF2231 domain-containing protein [Actinophytocola oryzae]|uniref:DUF2231 domain-containing protein n=1 Tax=Actinophytocola oryzae TaxID=502181 RepID=A0A4R7V2S8_9PSEU|nr:DUF2231 domain-containing protein [Actinophytocola oryzae]TDV43678.1 hypothetical protein CLV71_115140 [Actinophytocola oryzae]
MPEFIGGLPVHPLLVHFTVVLIVIAVVGSVLTAVWPAVRRRYGWLAVGASAIGTLLVPFTTTSGANLAARYPNNPAIEKHEALGDLMIWWAAGLTVAVGALMVVHTMAARRVTTKVAVGSGGAEDVRETEPAKAPVLVVIVLAVITVGVAVGAGIHVYRVGDAGARAVWEGVENLPVQNGG